MAKIHITAGPFLSPDTQEVREEACADDTATEEMLGRLRQRGQVRTEAEAELRQMVCFERCSVTTRKPNSIRSFTTGSLAVGGDFYKVFVEADYTDPKKGFVNLHIQAQRIVNGVLDISSGIQVMTKHLTQPSWAQN
jgi:hypothetical protein